MRNRLLLFGSFAHDPQRILAAINRLTLVGIELLLDGRLGIPHVGVSRKLGVTAFADSEHRDVPNSLHDPKNALWHAESLAHRQALAQNL